MTGKTNWTFTDLGVTRGVYDETDWHRWRIETRLDMVIDAFAVAHSTNPREFIAEQLKGAVLDHFLQCANEIIDRMEG